MVNKKAAAIVAAFFVGRAWGGAATAGVLGPRCWGPNYQKVERLVGAHSAHSSKNAINRQVDVNPAHLRRQRGYLDLTASCMAFIGSSAP